VAEELGNSDFEASDGCDVSVMDTTLFSEMFVEKQKIRRNYDWLCSPIEGYKLKDLANGDKTGFVFSVHCLVSLCVLEAKGGLVVNCKEKVKRKSEKHFPHANIFMNFVINYVIYSG
jgi:hypothetical protein